MENTLAVGTKSSPLRSALGSGSRPGLPYPSGRGSLVETPPPHHSKQIQLSAEPEPTAHAGGAATAGMPNIGDIVLGFRIVEKLGQGGFGSVFLGEQVGLADRPVALKFTSRATAEPERMAALQHTNVVPVYSVHSQPPLQVLCMPYRGRHTLADAVRAIARTKSLPATGAGLLSTTPKAMDVTRRSRRPKAPAAEGTPAAPAAETPQPIRDMLVRLSFPESVVWLFGKLADGLAHAHDRGIVHLDLKPANVLVTDDGMPMILDFGLAHDLRDVTYAVTGGTVRYMSPEQLEGFVAPDGFVPDRRMDLYSLGVMFFELLTGRHPFEDGGTANPSLPTLLAARRTVAPRATAFNRHVAPAVAAIVAKLLQPDPADRYQTAHQLLADLTRHQESRPLKYAGNPSLAERVRKFRRRHPIAAVAAVAVLFAAAAALATGAAVTRGRERAALAAAADADKLDKAAVGLRLDLPATEQARRRVGGLATTGVWFDKYGVGRDDAWADRPAVAHLPDASRQAVRRTLGEMAVLAAHAEELSAVGKGHVERTAAYRRALAWNARAATCFAGLPVPPVVGEQAERLAGKVGDPAPPRPDREAEATSFDRYVRGVILLSDGQYAAAAKGLEALVAAEPGHAAGQFSLGAAYQAQGRFADALERLQVAKALSPTDSRPCHQRGVLLLATRRVAAARAEFDTAIERDPTTATAHYHRAIARSGLGDWAGGVGDITRAMELGEPAFRCLLLRARMNDLVKDDAAARADRAAAAKLAPEDETDFVARGLDRLRNGGNEAADWQVALADFEKAVELNPRYLNAWQNQAHVYADKLAQPDKAIAALDKALALAPEYAPARAGRAVVLARLGKRADAHAEAEKALALTADPTVRYQVACVYALTSKDDPTDAAVAVQHLRRALRDGYAALDDIETDADLADLRASAEYRQVIAAAKQMRAK